MVAQCVPPPFAAVLSGSVFVHQAVGATGVALMARLESVKIGTEAAVLTILCESVQSRLTADPGDVRASRASVFTASPVETPFATSAGLLASHVVDLGKQGVWQYQWRRRVSCGCAPDVI